MKIPPVMMEEIIVPAASAHGIPADIVAAVVMVESTFDPWATRMEPDYAYLWNVKAGRPYRVRPEDRTRDRAPADFPSPAGVSAHTEWICQQTSYGLMQVMGAVAREKGFTGRFLAQLCAPGLGVEFGCRVLAGLKKSYLHRYGWEGVLRGYNGGPAAVLGETNPEYPAKVLRAMGGGQWPR